MSAGIQIPISWHSMLISEAVFNIPLTGKKIPQKQYLEMGAYPVIDQGQPLIGGYSDDAEALVDCLPPAIVFGDHTKVVKLVKFRFAPGADGIKVLKPNGCFNCILFKYFLDHLVTGLIDKGYARHYQHLANCEINVPPIAEQQRIVAKIEELFSELDAGVANLKKARAQLAVYRQALLKHAFEGRLTAEWRGQHAEELESAEELLERIRAEREKRYQQRLKDWKKRTASGEECSKPRDLIPWAEPSGSEFEDLPPLPSGWSWIPFSNLCQLIRNGISAKPVGDKGDKILRISAVRPMKVDLDDFRYIQGSEDEYEEYALETGDLLFTRYNGSRKFVGVCGYFRGGERRLFPDKLIQGRLGVESALPGFIEAAFGCGASRKFVELKIRTTAGQAGVSGGDIKAVPVPICSIAEQNEIVRFLEESLPNIDALEADIDQNLQRAEALRQSILKKAFAGELVPQDPADEPAAVLLARILGEREAAATVAKAGKTRKIKAA